MEIVGIAILVVAAVVLYLNHQKKKAQAEADWKVSVYNPLSPNYDPVLAKKAADLHALEEAATTSTSQQEG